ncbi:uncharacterized protein LOC123258179 [Drosophila ananassae]|uniref:uncharacterized protein LOC123258179 n=1 Tax=Drosophila ananassae TaxID=7217 RepID=UPI001CFFC8C2|nr:uncharacterized protein LOC123258179 [Drosophila ananassae]
MDDKVDVSLVIAKSKVAPLKPLSIQRMELQAAVMGARLAHKVMSTRNLRIDNATYWSDSKTVLQWPTMDPRNLHQFVMHRVAEILETTPVLSPAVGPFAAERRRWTKITDQTQQKTWITGPGFLKIQPLAKTDKAGDHHRYFRNTEACDDNACEISSYVQCALFSNWWRLYRAVALFVDRLRAKRAKQDMPTATTMDHVSKAKMLLYKQSQAIAFAEELERRCTKETDWSNRLNAYLNNDGVLQTRGRLNSIDIAEDAIILVPGCRITNLIVRSFHEKYHHHATTSKQ